MSVSRAARLATACGVAVLVGLAAGSTGAQAAAKAADRVLLISIAGLHEFDLEHFITAHPDSVLAGLKKRAVAYTGVMAPRPSDSFPGVIALMSGALPRQSGIFYDDTWDRALSPAASDCGKKGGAAQFDEEIDVDDGKIDTKIDEKKLPRDPANGCSPVYPHQYLRVNTVFEVVKANGGRTAWADKHPAYEILEGPSGKGIDDLYTPEITAGKSDQAVDKSIVNDELRVAVVLNQIAGKDSAGAPAVVPTLFGMNFETLSVAEKYAGYQDAKGTPSGDIEHALGAIDQDIGKLLAALDTAKLSARTAVIVTAKHGQAPVDPKLKRIVDSKLVKSTIGDALAYATLDDVGLIWLKDASTTPAVVKTLTVHRADLGIAKLWSGKELLSEFGDPAKDSRVPDILIEAQPGVIYTKPTATKVAEHGGFSADDRHVGLLVALPGGHAKTVAAPVETRSVAPTMLELPGIDPKQLQGVAKGKARPLPGL
jgi:Type I phosphodiesterase / nucleotide pyrophosphatase